MINKEWRAIQKARGSIRKEDQMKVTKTKSLPFILRFIETKKTENAKTRRRGNPYSYDEKESLTMVQQNNVKTPLIKASPQITET